jgi:hypothetical protein
MSEDRGEPNKPKGQIDETGKTVPVDERQAIRNQGSVSPEDYPKDVRSKGDVGPGEGKA